MTSPKSTLLYSSRPTKPISCLNCRSSHLKCDLQQPSCARCIKSELKCIYTCSRRGRRNGSRAVSVETSICNLEAEKSHQKYHHSRPSEMFDIASEMEPGVPYNLSADCSTVNTTASLRTSSPSAQSNPCDSIGNFPGLWDGIAFDFGSNLDFLGPCLNADVVQFNVAPTTSRPSVSQATTDGNCEHLVALFYKHFQPAHPFVIPYRLYMQRRASFPRSLQSAMQFAGSHFAGSADRRWIHCPDIDLILCIGLDALYTIQGLLILAITCYGRGQGKQSLKMLDQARTQALSLRLYDRITMSSICRGDRVLEESVSRTWWELCSVTSIMSAFGSSDDVTPFELPTSDLDLPCEEKQYKECNIPIERRTQQNFFDRSFSGDTFEYSSFAYKVEASRLLMSVRALGSDWWSIEKDRISTVDNSLSNYHLSIPLKKREVMENSGTIDEIIFSARILASVAIILMCRPRSSLVSINKQPRISCTERTADIIYETSGQHTFEAVQAANGMADAAGTRSSPCAVICHSPFFACALALASTVQLPAYVLSEKDSVRESLRERIKLITNALARMGENWPVAKVIESQITDVIREVLGCSKITQVVSMTCVRPENTVHGDWPDKFPEDLGFLNGFPT